MLHLSSIDLVLACQALFCNIWHAVVHIPTQQAGQKRVQAMKDGWRIGCDWEVCIPYPITGTIKWYQIE